MKEPYFDHFLYKCLENSEGIAGVVHVGAHALQERALYKSFSLDVVWIDADAHIIHKSWKNLASGSRYLHYLITNENSKKTRFYITNNKGASSSIFKPKIHKILYPGITVVEMRMIRSRTLDSALKLNKIPYKDYNFLTIDVQGAEKLVLEGADKYLRTCRYINTEINYSEMYEGGVLYDDLHRYLVRLGYKKRYEQEKEPGYYGNAFYERKKW